MRFGDIGSVDKAKRRHDLTLVANLKHERRPQAPILDGR
jgi:hypothetical protein